MANETVKMTRSNFGELMTPIHKKVFFEAYNEKPKTYVNTFGIDTMKMKQESFQHIGALGKWEENTEGADFKLDQLGQEQKVTFTAKRFDKSYEVTWELMQDDQYSVFKGIGKGGSAKNMARGLHATEEQAAADIIIGGFSNTGYDGVALFSDEHPTNGAQDVTYPETISPEAQSNLITGGLTDAKLKEALTLLRLQRDDRGTLIAANAKKLVISPEWEFTARALINSTLQAGTNNNDINTVPSLKIIVWDYLANDTTKPWYVQDDSIDNLKFLWREKPIFDSEKIPNKMDYRFYGYCRFDCGYVDWHGLVGSAGVDAAAVTEET